MNLLKQEKGSITLFVLISMIFFLMFLVGMYMLSATAESGVIQEQARIKEIYEQGVNNIDEVYATLENESKQKLKNVIKVGDYVAYDSTAGVTDKNLLTYTSPVGTGMLHGNGCSKTSDNADLSGGQTFTANSNIKWKVLSIDDETGEIVLISEEPIRADNGIDFHMQGAIGYLYAEQELNEICKIYGYGKGANTLKIFEYEIGDAVEGIETRQIIGSGARSIKAEDINQIIGYTPKLAQTYSHTISYPTLRTISGVSETKETRTDPSTSYNYAILEYLDNTSNIYKTLFRNKDDTRSISYWLASRTSWNSSNNVNWTGKYVESDKVTGFEFCNDGNFTEAPRIHGVRPIVYLKPNIQTTGQDGNGTWVIVD